MCRVGPYSVLFGGMTFNLLNDIWYLDSATDTWIKLK